MSGMGHGICHGRGTYRLLLASVMLLGMATSAHAQWLQALRKLDAHNADVTALVVNLRDMHTIAALNPDERLTPASVSKLFATANALQEFGPDHTFTTRFASTGRVTGGVLHGDLVLVGGGDPALDTANIRTLVQKLRAAGVREVTGNLIIDNGLFGRFSCFIKDRCDAETHASRAYSAPLSSAGVNFGTVKITITPAAKRGGKAEVKLFPTGMTGYNVDNQVKTGSTKTRPQLGVWRGEKGGYDTIHVRGKLPAGGHSYTVYRAAANAAEQTRRVVATVLSDARIVIEGTSLVKPVSGTMHTLARIRSNSLSQMIIPMLAYSNNYMADLLTLDTAAARGAEAPISLSSASRQLEKLSRKVVQEAYPTLADTVQPAIFTSGSGLSVTNSISARHLISLLSHMYHQPALFPAFYGAIPVPASSATRTLKHGNHAWLTRLVAKTGTLTEPVTVRALAGYFRMRNGDFGAFAVIINGTQQRPSINFHDTVLTYQKDIEAILAQY